MLGCALRRRFPAVSLCKFVEQGTAGREGQCASAAFVPFLRAVGHYAFHCLAVFYRHVLRAVYVAVHYHEVMAAAVHQVRHHNPFAVHFDVRKRRGRCLQRRRAFGNVASRVPYVHGLSPEEHEGKVLNLAVQLFGQVIHVRAPPVFRYWGVTVVEVPHVELKAQSASSVAVVRTGECHPYCNVILESNVSF